MRLFISLILLMRASVALSNSAIDSIINSQLPKGSSVEFHIGGSHPYSFEKGSVKTPASLTKIYTAYMGTQVLGDDYRFPIQVSWKQSGNDISDLIIFSYGAPEFSPSHFIKRLKEKGVKNIHGQIVIDGSLNRAKPKDRTQIDDSGYCYNAIPSALNYQQNCVSLTVRANGVQSSDPDLSIMPFKTDIKLGSRYNATRPHFKWLNRSKTEFEYLIQVNLKSRSQSAKVDVVVPDTDEWMIEKIIRTGESLGVQFYEDSTDHFSTENGFRMNSLKSKDVICASLKESVNIYSHIIFDLISSSQKKSLFGSYNVNLRDGSGMSRRNQISASGLLRLLEDISNSQYYKKIFSCLPAPGKKGTLDKRLLSLSKEIVAKTGSLSGMTHLAGYIKSRKSGEWVPFVFMFRNSGLRVKDMRQIQDKIMEDLYDNL